MDEYTNSDLAAAIQKIGFSHVKEVRRAGSNCVEGLAPDDFKLGSGLNFKRFK